MRFVPTQGKGNSMNATLLNEGLCDKDFYEASPLDVGGVCRWQPHFKPVLLSSFSPPLFDFCYKSHSFLFLHQTGSSNPLGVNSNYDKLPFHQYYSIKDMIGFMVVFILFRYICFFNPWLLGDPENFISANPLVTPVHIQPEWYFLFAYAILRSIPNKLGGVVALAASVAVLYTLGFAG